MGQRRSQLDNLSTCAQSALDGFPYDIATYDLSPERHAIGDVPGTVSETLIMRNRSTARAV
jgi:hypothetical protein